jgi:hypothetical protein
MFIYALKAPESKRQYPRRFKTFLYYLNLKGTIQEQVKQFLAKTRAKKINAHIEKTYEDVYDNMT